MTALTELIQQLEALEAQIAQVRQTEVADAIAKVKELIVEFDLTAQEIFSSAKRGPKVGNAAKNPVAPKYRDLQTGQTWSGRGLAPKWIEGKDRYKFAI